jgi:hypothetical protein
VEVLLQPPAAVALGRAASPPPSSSTLNRQQLDTSSSACAEARAAALQPNWPNRDPARQLHSCSHPPEPRWGERLARLPAAARRASSSWIPSAPPAPRPAQLHFSPPDQSRDPARRLRSCSRTVLHSHLLKRAVCSTADASATIAPWGYRFSPACDPAPLPVPVDKLIPSATTRVARYLANGISPSDSVGPSFLRFNLCQHVPAIASITWLTPPTATPTAL